MYVGLPLGKNPHSSRFWPLVVERIQDKVHNWKYVYISKGGRHTLVQSTLSGIPTYYLSLFHAPMVVINSLKKLVRDFL